MYRVLVPLDNSIAPARTQVEYVTSLPCPGRDVAVVLGLLWRSEAVVDALLSSGEAVPAEIQGADAVKTVQDAMAAFDDAGIQAELRRLGTPPAKGILEIADAEQFDAIVMGGRKHTPALKAILGSVAQQVILNAEVPVVVTGEE